MVKFHFCGEFTSHGYRSCVFEALVCSFSTSIKPEAATQFSLFLYFSIHSDERGGGAAQKPIKNVLFTTTYEPKQTNSSSTPSLKHATTVAAAAVVVQSRLPLFTDAGTRLRRTQSAFFWSYKL